jgi:uncharacterized lipoprotein YajG
MDFSKLIHYCAIAAACILLSACSTTPVNLTYNPSNVTPKPQAKAAIEQVVVTDKRGVDAKWIGAIRSGYGNPMKTLESTTTVSAEIKTAFTDGLRARSLLAPNGPYRLDVVVSKFDCSQYARREAHANMDIMLVNQSSRQVIYIRPVSVTKISGDRLTLDAWAFGKVEDLLKVANDALQEAVDKALDDPELLAAAK